VTAIRKGNFAGVKLLIRNGVSLNERNSEGRYPIQEACQRGNIHMVEYLVQEKADIHAQPSSWECFTALHFAVERGHIDIVKFLLQNGANVDCQSHGSRGQTLLEVCTSRDWFKKANFSREEMFKILIEAGSPIDGPPVRRCRQWNSALTGLILGSANDELIELAFNAGADVNSPGSGRGARSPIQAAAQVGNLRLVKKLLAKGANINAPAAVFHGRTALQAACSQDIPNEELVRFLLQNGAEVNAEAGIDGGLTALQGAAIQGHIKIVLLLHDAGADVSAPPAPKNGRTALEGAAEHGRLDMVQILLNAISASGKTWRVGYDRAVKLARTNSHYAVSELLESQPVEQVGR
jgi:ankyrin repeat protein